MNTPKTSLLQRLLKFGMVGALSVAVLVWPLYFAAKAGAETYQQIAPVDEAAVDVNRFLYAEDPSGQDEDIVAIYGLAVDGPKAYVFVDNALVLHPEEKPELTLLRRPAEGQPLQLAGLFSRLGYTSLAALFAALGMLTLRWVLVRRSRRAAAN